MTIAPRYVTDFLCHFGQLASSFCAFLSLYNFNTDDNLHIITGTEKLTVSLGCKGLLGLQIRTTVWLYIKLSLGLIQSLYLNIKIHGYFSQLWIRPLDPRAVEFASLHCNTSPHQF